MPVNGQAPYIQDINDDLSSRSRWNDKDNQILKKRMCERPTKTKYIGAPNAVVSIIDDNVSERTDQEISMIMNAPFFAHFIPLADSDQALVQKAQIGFDTLLRHFMDYRAKKETAVDMKNARGFAITKIIREEHPTMGVIPSFETIDLKDIVVSMGTKKIRNANRICHVLRFNAKSLRDKEKQGWKNIDLILGKIEEKSKSATSTASSSSTRYSAEDNVNNTLKQTEQLIGINTSNPNEGEIVVWEVAHYATDWDIESTATDWPDVLEKDRKCMTYICPDVPEVILYAKSWKREVLEQTLDPITNQPVQVLVDKGDKHWPYVQHRFELRSEWWYDTRGIGHTCMDNQIAATGILNRKLIWMDYAVNPFFENDGGEVNPANIKLQPGSVLPRGLKMAKMIDAPQQLSFDLDYFKRDSGRKAGTGTGTYSEDVAATRKLQKSATEVASEDSKRAMTSSASVDRFNDADRELFQQIWEDCKELGIQLPMIQNNKYLGLTPQDIYNLPMLIVPAGSQKTLNPDHQYLKWKDAFGIVMSTSQQIPLDIQKGLEWGLTYFDPNFAAAVMIDPKQAGPQGQPPIYMQLNQIMQAIQSMGANLESTMKLSVETADKAQKLEEKQDADVEETVPEGPVFNG
jgi:hypothetical protein